MLWQADNTEFGLASGVFTENIDKATIYCVFSVNMQHQANNTEFSLASGVSTKNINKSITHCVFSVNMQHQANNTEFSLASGVFTKNINKSIIHCVFSVMSRACCDEQTTQSLAWRQVCSQRTSTKRCMWRTRCRLAQSSSTPTTKRTLLRPLVDSNSPASAKIWVKKKEILCCLIPVGNYENFSCIVGSLLLQQD